MKKKGVRQHAENRPKWLRAVRSMLYGLACGTGVFIVLLPIVARLTGTGARELWLTARAERTAWLGVVDRVEEGKAIVVPSEVRTDSDRKGESPAPAEAILPLDLLPARVKEGEVVAFIAMLRSEKTKEQRARIEALVSRLCNRQ